VISFFLIYLSSVYYYYRYCFLFVVICVVLNGQAKQKQKGAERLVLPSVQGEEGGKWIVIDSGLCCSF
jgi:hypothetical protein